MLNSKEFQVRDPALHRDKWGRAVPRWDLITTVLQGNNSKKILPSLEGNDGTTLGAIFKETQTKALYHGGNNSAK